MRLWPRSIRARDTVQATVGAAVLLAVLGTGVDLVLWDQAQEDYGLAAERTSTRITAAYRDHSLGARIPPGGRDQVVQVVAIDGRILAATPAGARIPPVSTHRPPPNDRVRTWTHCSHGDCEVINAIRVSTADDAPVVYTVGALPWLLNAYRLEIITAAIWALILALVAGSVWWRVGKTLRPIMEIRSQLAEFSISDLSRRVPQPPGHDEIAQLARTANSTLDRLELAVERQRRFSSDASHELRTPIAGLRTQLESALLYPDDTDLLATIRSALGDTDRLGAIVDDLLLMARLGTDVKEKAVPVDLGSLVAEEVERREGMVIGTSLAKGVVVMGVKMQLLRILVNLLDNAERYGGGVVDVVVGTQGGKATLMVTDRGPGIPKEDRERIFERFLRLDTARSRSLGGTGLGLAIARDIARAHGGALEVADSPTGARFVLRLPLLRPEHTNPA